MARCEKSFCSFFPGGDNKKDKKEERKLSAKLLGHPRVRNILVELKSYDI